MITSFYAGLLALIFVILSAKVVLKRRSTQTSFGDNGDPAMLRAVRIQGNFAEYVPFALLMLALYEMQAGSIYLVHGLGIALVVARVAHAIGLKRGIVAGRVLGTALTLAVLIVLGVLLILKGITAVQVL